MKQFQILNPAGQAIPIGELDREAAAFWGKPLHEKQYANPTPIFTNPKNLEGRELSAAMFKHELNQVGNWYDIIGWHISTQGNECSGWSNVAASMMASQLGMKFIDLEHDYATGPVIIKEPVMTEFADDKYEIKFPEDLALHLWAAVEYFKPYIALMNHWQSKGYTPKQIKE